MANNVFRIFKSIALIDTGFKLGYTCCSWVNREKLSIRQEDYDTILMQANRNIKDDEELYNKVIEAYGFINLVLKDIKWFATAQSLQANLTPEEIIAQANEKFQFIYDVAASMLPKSKKQSEE